jgi:hypothetical protein
MDSEHSNKEEKQETGDSLSDSGDVLQPFRVRRSICSCDEINRVLLDYGFNFLLPVGAVLWTLLACFIIT